jgi:hypothetical protein
VRLAKLTENLLKSNFDTGKAIPADVAVTSHARANAQIRLLKEKEAKRQ